MTAKRKPVDPDQVRVPAHLSAFVDVLGVDGAVDFLLTFGGGYSYFSLNPEPASPVASVIGTEKTAALAKRLGGGSMRVPTGKPFIARVLRAKGMGASAIARKLHVLDTSVRNWLQEDRNSRQLTLFELPPPIDHQP